MPDRRSRSRKDSGHRHRRRASSSRVSARADSVRSRSGQSRQGGTSLTVRSSSFTLRVPAAGRRGHPRPASVQRAGRRGVRRRKRGFPAARYPLHSPLPFLATRSPSSLPFRCVVLSFVCCVVLSVSCYVCMTVPCVLLPCVLTSRPPTTSSSDLRLMWLTCHPHTRIHQWTMGGRVWSSQDRQAGGIVSYLVNRLGCQSLTSPRSEGVRSLNFFSPAVVARR